MHRAVVRPRLLCPATSLFPAHAAPAAAVRIFLPLIAAAFLIPVLTNKQNEGECKRKANTATTWSVVRLDQPWSTPDHFLLYRACDSSYLASALCEEIKRGTEAPCKPASAKPSQDHVTLSQSCHVYVKTGPRRRLLLPILQQIKGTHCRCAFSIATASRARSS